MKTAELKTLIDELAVYEQELHEKVRQKESELDTLLRRVLMDSRPPCSPQSLPQLRIGNPPEALTVAQPCDDCASIDIDDVSSITRDSVASADSPQVPVRPPRRVRFSSRSPQVALAEDLSPRPLTAPGAGRRGRAPRDKAEKAEGAGGEAPVFLRRGRGRAEANEGSRDAVLSGDSVGPQRAQGSAHGESSVLLVRSGLSVKRPRAVQSRSVSAAREHAAQQEGRGAGIVLACGPTLFLD